LTNPFSLTTDSIKIKEFFSNTEKRNRELSPSRPNRFELSPSRQNRFDLSPSRDNKFELNPNENRFDLSPRQNRFELSPSRENKFELNPNENQFDLNPNRQNRFELSPSRENRFDLSPSRENKFELNPNENQFDLSPNRQNLTRGKNFNLSPRPSSTLITPRTLEISRPSRSRELNQKRLSRNVELSPNSFLTETNDDSINIKKRKSESMDENPLKKRRVGGDNQ